MNAVKLSYHTSAIERQRRVRECVLVCARTYRINMCVCVFVCVCVCVCVTYRHISELKHVT